ncbi:pentapeptide repeat-containing protein [Marinifilum flexuosum]|uniref:Uncharacterized protein YjbI with pentapeptide repeats n=1 Tax=Marinifilum flexuosum TaxID=1117708 RepID=A0A419X2T9_9BACT|nr:pentapeptide repeat-containing protein [Marinifilum flexuosum]RKE02066.1 uncharacterized protein YjbI with pentapeptide repeats [Marinifilum flexuosum]
MNLFKSKTILFAFEAPEGSKVEIAGDFTNWLEAPLKLHDKGDGVYERKISFKRSGTFQYKYRINEEWVEIMEELQPQSNSIPNAFGTRNFFIDIDLSKREGAEMPAAKKDKIDAKVDKKAYELLIACSDKGDFGEWDRWREQNHYERIYLQGVNFSSRNFEKVNLSNINFHCADFSYAFLSLVNFDACDLRDTDFRKAWFSNGSAKKTNFTMADMRGATINGTEFLKSRMIGTDLRGASAKYVHIEGTDLHHAKIESANFSFAIVDGETLIDTIDVDKRTLFTSVGLSSARLRSGLMDTLNYNIRRNRWEEWFKTGSFMKRLYKNMFIHLFWKISDYGRSTRRILYIFTTLALVFGCIYWFNPEIITNMNSNDTIIKALHTVSFSVVTMITLGFGSMNAAPASLLGHITVALQIIAGYMILAALVSRIAIMFDSEGPDVEHKPLYRPYKDDSKK